MWEQAFVCPHPSASCTTAAARGARASTSETTRTSRGACDPGGAVALHDRLAPGRPYRGAMGQGRGRKERLAAPEPLLSGEARGLWH